MATHFLFPLLLFLSFLVLSMALELHGGLDPTRVSQLSWQPRAFLFKGFLSYEECDHLISMAADKLEKSTVADNHSGNSLTSEARTSYGMFLDKHQDDIISGIEKRIAAWTFLPEENGEPIQVLRYQTGQRYVPHYDFFVDERNQARGGHRAATVLMYLSNVDKGGETVFPYAEETHSQQRNNETWSHCAQEGYAVKPEKGDALLFFSLHPDASTDARSLHESCPVIEGEKWSATKWIHVRSFNDPRYNFAGECYDENISCSTWAADGECQKNPGYMEEGEHAKWQAEGSVA